MRHLPPHCLRVPQSDLLLYVAVHPGRVQCAPQLAHPAQVGSAEEAMEGGCQLLGLVTAEGVAREVLTAE